MLPSLPSAWRVGRFPRGASPGSCCAGPAGTGHTGRPGTRPRTRPPARYPREREGCAYARVKKQLCVYVFVGNCFGQTVTVFPFPEDPFW